MKATCFAGHFGSDITRSNAGLRSGRCRRSPTMSAATRSLRIGHGFDLHRLEPGLPLILGGVELSHDRGCAGHSDGDAVYHCVVDAVLGALSLPDIGQLFPDTDPRFKGCPSHVFMTAAHEKMAAKGYQIGNLDVTIILEKPKMAPHKAKIRQNIADLLCTDLENVNIKAKTHEKVDAVGENRAVSVHAVAMLVANSPAERKEPDETSTKTVTGEAVANSLLGMVQQRVAGIEAMRGGEVESCAVQRLYDTISSRKGSDPSSSWTAKLFAKGTKTIAKKVGEEAAEVIIDASRGDNAGLVKESADLIYHLCVLWADADIEPSDVWAELASREGQSGLSEKASRKS